MRSTRGNTPNMPHRESPPGPSQAPQQPPAPQDAQDPRAEKMLEDLHHDLEASPAPEPGPPKAVCPTCGSLVDPARLADAPAPARGAPRVRPQQNYGPRYGQDRQGTTPVE